MNIQETDNVLAALGITGLADAGSGGDGAMRLDNLLMLAAGQRARLGELLQAAGRITEPQLTAALAEQRHSGRKLGEILVERSNLSAAEREVALEFQRHLAGERPTDGRLSLGNILVSTGQITRQQLINALKWQGAHGGRLGDALVACGHATQHHVEHGLSLQRRLVLAALVTALSLAAAAPVQDIYAAEPPTAKVTVRARIATFFRMQVEHQIPVLTITARDVERGYVEVPAASNFSVVTNTQDGFIVEFRPHSDMFRSVRISGLQSQIEIGADGGTALNNAPHGRTTFHQLDYRFMLNPGVQPGNYPWPLEISVRAP